MPWPYTQGHRGRLRSEAEVYYLNTTGLRRHDNTLIPTQARTCKTTEIVPETAANGESSKQQLARQGSMQRLQQQLQRLQQQLESQLMLLMNLAAEAAKMQATASTYKYE